MEMTFLIFMFLFLVGFIGLCLSPFYMIYMGFIKSEDVRIFQLKDGTYQVQRGKFFIKRIPTWFDWDCRYATKCGGWYEYAGSFYSLDSAISVRNDEMKRIQEEKNDTKNRKLKKVVG